MDLVSLTMVAILFAFGVVGLCMARKIRNGDSFYIMEEKAPTLFLVCGICMSYISAVTMSSGPGVCYENGPFLLLTTAQPGAWFGMLVALLFIGRKMKAIGCYTMPDYFAKRFSDNNVTCLALIIMMAVMEIYGIGQLVSIGTVLSEATGFSYGEIILIFTLAIIMFCVPGGTWGIMMTDTLMFVVVLLTAFIVCPVVIAALYPEAIQTLPASFWSVQGIHEAGLGYRISQTVLWFTFFAGSPVIITRVFPAKNDFAVFKATVISVVLIALISFLLYFTAGLMQGVEPGIVPQEQVILRAFRGHAPLIIGLIGVGGILTASISTASVLFCLAGFSVSHDLHGLLNQGRGADANELKRARIAQVFAIGIGGAVAHLQPGDSFDLSIFACGIFAASWLPSILMGLLWRRYDSTSAFYGMLTGALTLTILQVLVTVRGLTLPWGINHYVLSMAISVLVSVVLTLRAPADPEDARRHYLIRHARLSDLVIRGVRTDPDALSRLFTGYRRAQRVMIGSVVAVTASLVVLIVLLARFGFPGL